MVTAKARLKPVEELPKWMQCCAESIQAYREQVLGFGVITIVPQTIVNFRLTVCDGCYSQTENIKTARVLGTPGLPVIPFDFIDIQEGEEEPCQVNNPAVRR